MPQLPFLVTFTVILFGGQFLAEGGEHVVTTLVEGDVYVHVIVSVYSERNSTTGDCTNIDPETVQHLEAIKWVFQRLNGDGYIPGVKIGVRVSETCGSMEMAKEVALDLSTELAGDETNMRIVGVIGHDFSSESESISALLSALPDKFRLVQMSYFATALSLRDREVYSNFFRLIPPDDLQVETLVNFIQEMNYTYMAVIYGDDTYGQGLKDLLQSSIGSVDFCIPIEIPLLGNETDLQNLLQTKLINASPPISGVVVFLPHVTTYSVLEAVQNVLNDTNITTPVFVLSESNTYIPDNSKDTIKGSFVLSPRRTIIQQFEWTDRLANLSRLYEEVVSNKWLRDIYKDGFGCELADNFGDNSCAAKSADEIQAVFPDSAYTQYAVQTAMTLAKVVKETYLQVCNSGVCVEFLSLPRARFIQTANDISVHYDDDFGSFELDEFKSPDLEIEFNNSPDAVLKSSLPLYEVYNFQLCNTSLCLVRVSSLSNMREFSIEEERLQDYFREKDRKAQCPDGYKCSKCIESTSDRSVLFIPADLYVVGIAPIHEKGTTPLQCGKFKTGGLDIAESIRFAVREQTLDASVGVIIIDSCEDPQIIQENLLTLHRHGIYKDGSYIPVADKIIGYIGGWTSDISKAVAEISTRLHIPQISYASTASSLSRRSLYKYFLRIPTPDSQQAKFMVDLVKEHIKTNFVQILYSESEYGEGGRDILMAQAAEVGICVTQTIGINETVDVGAVTRQLREQKDANLVFVFVSSTGVDRILKELNNGIEQGEFLFIASEAWGRRFNVGSFSKFFGSITLTSELSLNDVFINAMRDLTIQSENDNFWIRPYMEWFFNCYSQWSFDKTGNQTCRDTLALDTDTTSYRIEVWSAFSERATVALLRGAKQAMDKYCGNSIAICENLRNNTDGFIDEIRSLTLNENGNEVHIFDDNGDGRAGYRIYVVSNKDNEEYFEIGSINPNSRIFFDTSKYIERGGQVLDYECSGQPRCLECFPVPPSNDKGSDLPVGLIVVVVLFAVVCCVLAAILLYICNKVGCCCTIENGRLRAADYITPYHTERIRAETYYNYIPGDGQVNTTQASVPEQPFNQNHSSSGIESASNGTGSEGSRSNHEVQLDEGQLQVLSRSQDLVSYHREMHYRNQQSVQESGDVVDESQVKMPAELKVNQNQINNRNSYLNAFQVKRQ